MRNLVFSVLVISALVFAPKIKAQEQFSLTIEPVFQEIVLEAEQEKQEASFTISNKSNQPIELELFAYDFKQTDHFGSLSLIDGIEEGYAHLLASFLSFDVDRFVLEAGEKKQIAIIVKDRDDLVSGGHYAAVVARSPQEEGENQQLVPALSSLVLLRKTENELIHLNLSQKDINLGSVRIFLPKFLDLVFINEGNTHVIPRGEIYIKNIFGQVVKQSSINQDSHYVLPGTRRHIKHELDQSRLGLPIMFYTLEIKGRADIGDVVFNAERSFVFIDLSVLVISVLVISLLIFKIRRKWRKR